MAEENLWNGSPSQIKNLGAYVACILVALLILIATLLLKNTVVLVALPAPALFALVKWLAVRSHAYRLTTERLLTTEGILSRSTESLELYRVKDIRMTQPLFQRLFGLETIELITSDQDTPDLVVDHIPTHLKLSDKIRQQVEACRVQKRTSEVELE